MRESKSFFIKARVTREMKEEVEISAMASGIDESEFVRRAVAEKLSVNRDYGELRALIVDQGALILDAIHDLSVGRKK